MGAYLSSPVCDKETIEGSNDHIAFAASSMQGWRMTQEDAHNALLDFDKNTSFFAVYDGHGGAEIALYCARHLPDFIKQLNAYNQGNLSDALTEGFLKFDALLLDPNVKEILQTLADSKNKNDDDNEDDGEQIEDGVEFLPTTNIAVENNEGEELNVEEAKLLKKEAELPIAELLKRYGNDIKNLRSSKVSNKTNNKSSKIKNDTTKDANESKDPETDSDQSKSNEDESVDVTKSSKDLDEPTTENVDNNEQSGATNAEPSSSKPKSTSKRTRTNKPVEATTDEPESLTHHLLSDDIDDLEDDEDDFELDAQESDEESSDDEAEEEDDEDDDEDEDIGVEDDEENDKDVTSNRAANMKMLVEKSLLAMIKKRSKKKKNVNDDESNEDEKDDDDCDENEDVDGEETNEEEEEEEDDDDDDDDDEDDGNDADLGKILDMSSDPGSSSGCTAAVALIRDKQLYVANAGDSRCVVCRNGRAIEMSNDHKPEDAQERERIEKAGYKVTLDGRVSGGLNLSRAIGDHSYKRTATLPAEEQAITALPDIRTMTLENQDEFMVIACDGIWNSMSSQEVVDFIRPKLQNTSLREICEALFMCCLAPNTSGDGTGCDNMTAIIVKFNWNQDSTATKTTDHSPWATMFAPVNNKRPLSPDNTSAIETPDNSNSKKLKSAIENGSDEVTSPSKTTGRFSFNAASSNNNNNNNNSIDEQHQQ